MSNSHEIPFHGIRERNDIYAGWTTAQCMWNHMKNVFCVMMSVTISAITKCSVLLYPQLFVWGLMSYLRYICLFAHSGFQHIVFYVFHRLVYPMLPVSLDCLFWLPTRYSLTFISKTKDLRNSGNDPLNAFVSDFDKCLRKPKGTIQNGQSWETGNIGYTGHRTLTNITSITVSTAH